MAGSNAQCQFSNIKFTFGTTPTILDLGEATSIEFDDMGTLISKGGGNSPGDTHQKLVNQKRTATISGFDVKKFMAVPRGVEGKLTFNVNDEENGEGIGSLNVELDNCMIPGGKVSSKYNDYSDGSITFTGRWKKDTVSPFAYLDPLTVTEVTS